MASTFYVTAQTEDVQEALKETSLSIPKISRKFLTIIGQKTSAVVKTGIRQTYSPPSKYYKRTGDFLRAWTYHARKDGSQVAVYPKVIYTTSDGQRKNRQWAAGLSSILNYGTKDGWLEGDKKASLGRLTGDHCKLATSVWCVRGLSSEQALLGTGCFQAWNCSFTNTHTFAIANLPVFTVLV